MTEEEKKNTMPGTREPTFKKKTYTQIDPSSLKHSISIGSPQSSSKKIIATKNLKGLREEFKRTFLPMLIDVFELRQTLENIKLKEEGTPFIPPTKSPEEILTRLTEMQESIFETQRWCDGVIGQIAKGIDDAKQAIVLLDETKEDVKERISLKKP